MRWLPLLLLAACDWTQPDTGGPHSHPTDPDAAVNQCGIGEFEVVAPKPDLHYAPTMIVYVDERELWAVLQLTMVDENGMGYVWTDDGSVPFMQTDGSWWRHDSFDYTLAPNHRYTLTVGHDCPQTLQTVTFFTSAQ